MQLGYLYSRYPVLSQTFCDMEMLELERRGYDLVIGAIHPPLTTLRHEHIGRFRSPIYYAPPAPVMALWEKTTRDAERWPQALIEQHEREYGPAFKAALRARNASYFADLFTRKGVRHFHVHFANRAAHTALFVKEISGIPFSITAHGQDFMSDLGQDDLLREICNAAEFVAVETDYSRGLLQERVPGRGRKNSSRLQRARPREPTDATRGRTPARPDDHSECRPAGRVQGIRNFPRSLCGTGPAKFRFPLPDRGRRPAAREVGRNDRGSQTRPASGTLRLALARRGLFQTARLRYFRPRLRGRRGRCERCFPDRDHGGDGLREAGRLDQAGGYPGVGRRRRDGFACAARRLGSICRCTGQTGPR